MFSRWLDRWRAKRLAHRTAQAIASLGSAEIAPPAFPSLSVDFQSESWIWARFGSRFSAPYELEIRHAQLRGHTWLVPALGAMSSLVTRQSSVGSVDLREVTGFTNSRSPIAPHATIEEFVANFIETPYSGTGDGTFEANIAHYIGRRECGEHHFFRSEWSGNVWLANHDGSHHTSVAIVQARTRQMRFEVPGLVDTYAIDGDAVRRFAQGYRAVFVGDRCCDVLAHRLADVLRAEPHCLLPENFMSLGPAIILLPVGVERSILSAVVDHLEERGLAMAVDRYLLSLVNSDGALGMTPSPHTMCESPYQRT